MRSARDILVVIVAGVMLTGLAISCQGSGDRSQLIEQHKKLAGELRDIKLFEAAIEEYDKILAFDDLDVKTRANINYLVGRIYFENLHDYRQAAAYYVRARSLDPEGSFVAEASKNLVVSLEKIGQVLDARRELRAATDVDTSPRAQGDLVVATIGEDSVWLSQIDRQIQDLPSQAQRQLVSPKEKLEFVNQYIGMELMYRAAVRENYDADPEILRQQQQFHKQQLVNKYVLDKVMPGIRIDTMDVRNFYQANKDVRYNGAPYDSVAAQVFYDYQGEKAQQAFSEYIEQLASKEKVEVFERNIK